MPAIGTSNTGFTVSPLSQATVTYTWSGYFTISLDAGAVAPVGGYLFGLGAANSNGLGAGNFDPGATVTMAAGSGSVQFRYMPLWDGIDTITIYPPDGLGSGGSGGSGTSGTSGGVGTSGSGGAPQSVTVSGVSVQHPVSSGPTSAASSAYTEVDVRCYNADGTRRAMPDFDSISWEVAERGGMQTGTLQMLVPWEQTGWIGNEYLDVRLWGNSQVLYRGWVRQPQQELGNPERSSPTLHGLYEILKGFEVRRDFGYGPPVSPSRLFEDIVALYVTRNGRLPGLQVDITGVDALGLTLQGMQLTGQSVPQALDALCDLFPNQLIWGGDVDAQGRNRIYLRPRATAVKYRFVVGRDVTAFVYPRDCARIVNRIYVTGAKLDGSNGTNVSCVNLLPNASFEEGAPNNEIDGNVLVNPGFETNSAFSTSDNPWVTGGAAIQVGTGHSGNNSCELNNDDIAQEFVYQDFGVAGAPGGIHASCWWCGKGGLTWSPQIKLELWNGATMVASSYMPAPTVVDSNGYTFFHFQWDWVPTPVACTKVRVTYLLSSESATGFAGQTLLDDCSLWFDGPELAKSWRITNGSGGAWSAIDWRNRDFTPYDGDVMVKATAVITGAAGSYAEIATNTADRPKAQPTRAYFIQFQVFNAGTTPLHAAAMARVIKNGVIQATPVGASTAIAPGAWTPVAVSITTGSNCDAIEVGLRVYDSGVYYIDAAGMWADVARSPPFYVAGDTFQGVRDVTDYSSAAIGFGAAASIATFGEREASVSNADVIDTTSLDAYAISYFRAMAVPQIQATLRVENATADIGLVGLDGQVKLLNLPSSPDALTPVRIRYQAGSKIDLNIDLNNERPQLERLLRLVAAGEA